MRYVVYTCLRVKGSVGVRWSVEVSGWSAVVSGQWSVRRRRCSCLRRRLLRSYTSHAGGKSSATCYVMKLVSRRVSNIRQCYESSTRSKRASKSVRLSVCLSVCLSSSASLILNIVVVVVRLINESASDSRRRVEHIRSTAVLTVAVHLSQLHVRISA